MKNVDKNLAWIAFLKVIYIMNLIFKDGVVFRNRCTAMGRRAGQPTPVFLFYFLIFIIFFIVVGFVIH